MTGSRPTFVTNTPCGRFTELQFGEVAMPASRLTAGHEVTTALLAKLRTADDDLEQR